MIYLDHAATSFPKPPEVLDAVQRWYRDLGVSAARGAGSRCAEVAAEVAAVRRRLGAMCGVPGDRVAFTSGATEGIGLLLRGVLGRGARVLTTAFDHAAVARSLRALERALDVTVEVLPPRADGTLPAEDFAEAFDRAPADWVVFTHASNVTGLVLDAEGICRLARQRGARTLVDACQTAGLLPLDVGADALVASAHKALHGPPGLGLLAVRPEVEVRAVKQGGTGWTTADSALPADRHPTRWPTAMEAGTPNTPAILGLGAALDWLERDHRDSAGRDILAAGLHWIDSVAQRLRQEFPQVQLHGPAGDSPRVPILSFNVPGLDPAEAGMLLDSHGIHARVGHHCAPWIHPHLGTDAAGSVRLSPGPGCDPATIEAVVAALRLG